MNKVWVRYNPLMMIRLDTTSNVGENITEFHRQPKKTTMSIFQWILIKLGHTMFQV